MFLITEILIIYYHYPKNVHILVQLQSQADGTFSVINYAKHASRINYISVVGKLGTIGIGIWQV